MSGKPSLLNLLGSPRNGGNTDILAGEICRGFEAAGGTMLMVYENPRLKAPENTTLGFGVSGDRFDATMADLRSKGVVFEDYDIPEMGLKTVNGVAEMGGMKSAWFKDSEGNVLNLVAM